MRGYTTRLFKGTHVTIKDSVSGEVKDSYLINKATTKQKELVKYVRKTGDGGVYVELTPINENRAMPNEFFISNSVVYDPDSNELKGEPLKIWTDSLDGDKEETKSVKK